MPAILAISVMVDPAITGISTSEPIFRSFLCLPSPVVMVSSLSFKARVIAPSGMAMTSLSRVWAST